MWLGKRQKKLEQHANLDGEELGPQLCQPFWVHSCDALHVLLSGVDKLVVHDVVRRVTQAIQGTGGVEKAGHACIAILVSVYFVLLAQKIAIPAFYSAESYVICISDLCHVILDPDQQTFKS